VQLVKVNEPGRNLKNQDDAVNLKKRRDAAQVPVAEPGRSH
jgi:hypothetical protein